MRSSTTHAKAARATDDQPACSARYSQQAFATPGAGSPKLAVPQVTAPLALPRAWNLPAAP